MTARDVLVVDDRPGPVLSQLDDPTHVTRGLERAAKHALSFRYDAEFENVIGGDLRPGIPPVTRDQLIAEAERTLQPSPIRFVLAELATLRRATTIFGKVDRDDLEATYRIYADRLRGYPPDVVGDACRNGRFKAWPSLEDIEERCRRAVRSRRAILDALRRGDEEQQQRDGWRPPTEDDKSYVSAIVSRWRNQPPMTTDSPRLTAASARIEPINPPGLLPDDDPRVLAAAGLLGVDVESMSASTTQEDAMSLQ